jgi:uncharacterized protein
MSDSTHNPRHLDIAAFAAAGATLQGHDALTKFERLLDESEGREPGRQVHWQAEGHQQADASGHARNWLHLRAEAMLSLTCQRCLAPVDVALNVAQDFRFVADEQQAEAEDEASEEDVLALSRDFDLLSLVEDELLMALPFAPVHDTCPSAPRLHAQDADFVDEPAKPNPFAALSGLKKTKL